MTYTEAYKEHIMYTFNGFCKTVIRFAAINGLLDAYARKLAANMNKGYEITARVPSIIIAGGSNFPVRKKEKQSALEQEAAELKEGITAQAEDCMRAQKFVSLVRRYTSFDELTTPMLNEFIEKVVVHEADKSTGDRRQKVDIYFNFIGCFVPPKPEVILTAEEEAKAQKALAARNREREQNRLRMRQVRVAQRAAKGAGEVSRLVDLIVLLCYTWYAHRTTNRNI